MARLATEGENQKSVTLRKFQRCLPFKPFTKPCQNFPFENVSLFRVNFQSRRQVYLVDTDDFGLHQSLRPRCKMERLQSKTAKSTCSVVTFTQNMIRHLPWITPLLCLLITSPGLTPSPYALARARWESRVCCTSGLFYHKINCEAKQQCHESDMTCVWNGFGAKEFHIFQTCHQVTSRTKFKLVWVWNVTS